MRYFRIINLKGFDAFLELKEALIKNQEIQSINLVYDFDLIYWHFYYKNMRFTMHLNDKKEIEFYPTSHSNHKFEEEVLQKLHELLIASFELSKILTS